MPAQRHATPSYNYKYLECTTDGHNKFYEMSEDGTHKTFTAKYGPIGKTPQKKSYDMSDWNVKYDEKIKKGYIDTNKTNPKPPFVVNQIHLDRVNQVMTLLAAHANEIPDSREWIRDVGMVRATLKDPKSKGKGQLEADDMVYLNDVWKKIKHYAK